MTDLLVIQGHPDRSSFIAALSESYAAGARAEGARVRLLHLEDLDFDPILHRGHHGEQPFEPDLAEAVAAIRDASHVMFAFPTWWAAPPALVKGFIDRAFIPGVAFRYEPGRLLPVGLFAGRSARMLTSMDSPSPWYWWKHGRSTHRSFVDATLDFCGFGPIATTTIYSVRSLSEADRSKAIERLAREGASDARALARAIASAGRRAALPSGAGR